MILKIINANFDCYVSELVMHDSFQIPFIENTELKINYNIHLVKKQWRT